MGALYDIYTVHGKRKRKHTKPLKVSSKQWNKEVAAKWSHVWDILAQKGFAGPVPRVEYELRIAQQSFDRIQSGALFAGMLPATAARTQRTHVRGDSPR